MSHPQRLVLELLLQEPVPERLDASDRLRLQQSLDAKGLSPSQNPRIAAALDALEAEDHVLDPANDAGSVSEISPDNSFNEADNSGGLTNQDVNFDSLLTGFDNDVVLEEDEEEKARLAINQEDLELSLIHISEPTRPY